MPEKKTFQYLQFSNLESCKNINEEKEKFKKYFSSHKKNISKFLYLLKERGMIEINKKEG